VPIGDVVLLPQVAFAQLSFHTITGNISLTAIYHMMLTWKAETIDCGSLLNMVGVINNK
jgi:hypothetical protein